MFISQGPWVLADPRHLGLFGSDRLVAQAISTYSQNPVEGDPISRDLNLGKRSVLGLQAVSDDAQRVSNHQIVTQILLKAKVEAIDYYVSAVT